MAKSEKKVTKAKRIDELRKQSYDGDSSIPLSKRESKARIEKKRVSLPLDLNHSNLFNEKHANIIIVTDTDQFYVHKYIVDARCKKLLEGLQFKKNKKGLVLYEVKDLVEPSILKNVISYLYTDKIGDIDVESSVKIIKAAETLGLERMSQSACKILQQSLNSDNLFEMLKLCHSLKSDRAKDICLEFSILNHSKFIADTRVREIPITLFIEEAVLHEKMKEKVAGGWRPDPIAETVPSTFVKDFENLYQTMTGSDTSISVGKVVLKCHKAIVGHASSKLMELVELKDPIKLPKEFKGYSPEVFSALLKYLYYRGVDFDSLIAAQLITLSQRLSLSDLVDICQTKIMNGINTTTVLYALEVSYHPSLKEKAEFQISLQRKCRKYLLEHLKEISLDPLRNMHASISTDILFFVQKELAARYQLNKTVKESTTSDMPAEEKQEQMSTLDLLNEEGSTEYSIQNEDSSEKSSMTSLSEDVTVKEDKREAKSPSQRERKDKKNKGKKSRDKKKKSSNL